jgi:hypothetical protein
LNPLASCLDVEAVRWQLGMWWPTALQCLQLPPTKATQAVHLPSAAVPASSERSQASA